jgi:ribA/ribD-fused uncharacterized protein
MIKEFRGDHYFLSNFYPCPVEYRGVTYLCSESAFQAQKTTDPELREKFSTMSAAESKKAGRAVPLRSDWDAIKDSVMWDVLQAKFDQNKDLRDALLDTGTAHLEEGNNWGDHYWGTVDGKGENKLGVQLMHLREILQWEREFERSARFAIHEDFLKLYNLAQKIDAVFPDTPGSFTGTPSERLERQFDRMIRIIDEGVRA